MEGIEFRSNETRTTFLLVRRFSHPINHTSGCIVERELGKNETEWTGKADIWTRTNWMDWEGRHLNKDKLNGPGRQTSEQGQTEWTGKADIWTRTNWMDWEGRHLNKDKDQRPNVETGYCYQQTRTMVSGELWVVNNWPVTHPHQASSDPLDAGWVCRTPPLMMPFRDSPLADESCTDFFNPFYFHVYTT